MVRVTTDITASEVRDLARLESLGSILERAPTSPIGDILIEANNVFEQFENPLHKGVAEEAMKGIRSIAARAQPNDLLFSTQPTLPRKLSDIELLQLLAISGAVHELCYCCEMVQNASEVTWGGSTPVRFYLNSIYHYSSSMFLMDTNKPTHKDLPMGGTVIRVLYPLGLFYLLKPLKSVLDEPLGQTTFGDTILKLRHTHLVHGDFSPKRLEHLIRQTDARNPMQMELFAQFVWKFFHRLMILNLQVLALLESAEGELASAAIRYLASNIARQ
jgi:hypothetical protein